MLEMSAVSVAGRKGREQRSSVHHAQGKHPLAGSEERGIVFRHRALQLKMQGLSSREIGLHIQREYELVKTPPVGTVYDWIQAALREGMRGNEENTMQHLAIVIARSEAIIRVLMPFALDEFAVERKRVINGKAVRVVDEDAFKEMIKAAQEIRKQGESVLRAMGINRAAPIREKTTDLDRHLFIIQCVQDHIASEQEGSGGTQTWHVT